MFSHTHYKFDEPSTRSIGTLHSTIDILRQGKDFIWLVYLATDYVTHEAFYMCTVDDFFFNPGEEYAYFILHVIQSTLSWC